MHRVHFSAPRALALLLAVTVLASCGGDSPSTPPGPVVASVNVEPSTVTVLVPRTQLLTATVRDAGNAPISGKSVTWHSDNEAVATVNTSGTVTAVAPGTARVTATADGKVGTSTVTVQLPAVATVTITPATHTLGLGGSVPLTVAVRDGDGNTITGRTVTWSSNADAVATVDGNGMVRAQSAGTAIITATADGINGTAQILVTPTAAVIISSVTPAQMQQGQQAIITGSGFSTDPVLNQVMIGDLPATVLNASATSLTIAVPGACLPARDVAVRVTANGNTGERVHPWRPSGFLDVAVGQQVRLSGAAAACLQLAASTESSRYLIGVQSVSGVPFDLTSFTMRGHTPASVASGAIAEAHAGDHAHQVSHGGVELPTSRMSQLLRRHREAEVEFRALERQTLRRPMAAPGRTRSSAAMQAANAAAAAVPSTVAVGDTLTVRYPTRANSCNASTPVRAVVRYNGSRGVWLEDVANPQGGFSAADYAALGAMFDGDIYAANVEYFGQPTDLDGNNRIVILITQHINKDLTVLGRVYFSDLFPEDCPAANGGEFFYGLAPDSAGTLGGPDLTAAEARALYPGIIAHELAHVIQVGRRSFAPGATAFQTVWELEGQATLAEEIVGHKVLGNRPGQNYGFNVAWNEPEVSPIDWYISPIIDLIHYFGYQSPSATVPGAPEQCGWFDVATGDNMGPCLGGRNLYGVTWSFLRWLSDHYGSTFPGGEAALHRAMVTDTRSGFATFEALTGRPMDEMLAQWSATLYLDGRMSGLDPKLTLPSWDFHGGTGLPPGQARGIWANLIPNAQLRPRQVPFGALTQNAQVRAGSTAYFLIGGSARPANAIAIGTPTGGTLPSYMRVWVVRVE